MSPGALSSGLLRALTGPKAVFLGLLLLAGPQPGRAQHPDSSRTAVNLGLHAHYGFIIPHAKEIRSVSDSYPRGLEADLSFHLAGEKAWQYLKSYPRLGVSLLYTHFGDPQILGNAYALLFYAEPFLTAHKAFSLSFRLGTGLAYLDNIYHPEENPSNLFFSSRISFPLVASLMANYRLDRRLLLRTGLTYNHISNGGLQQPNKGINYPTLSAGFNYTLRPGLFPDRSAGAYGEQTQKQEFLLALLFSYPDRHDKQSQQAPLLGLTAYTSRQLSRLSALTAGAEWIADYALRPTVRRHNGSTNFQRGALLAGHEWRIGRIRFSQQLGIYVYAPYPARDAVYQRYGLEYHPNHKLFYGINLKSHREVADFLDARIGLRLK